MVGCIKTLQIALDTNLRVLNSTDVKTFSYLNPEPDASRSDDILHNNRGHVMTVMISVNKYVNFKFYKRGMV